VAKLYFRYGAMNSGKSTALLQAAFNYEERGQRVLLAKPVIDTKGASEIVSRLGVTREVDFLIPPDGDVETIYAEHADYVDHDALLESIDAPKTPSPACSSTRRSSSPRLRSIRSCASPPTPRCR
jgi:thymidine kinase